jgi:Tfp pilus assembly protein PilP
MGGQNSHRVTEIRKGTVRYIETAGEGKAQQDQRLVSLK